MIWTWNASPIQEAVVTASALLLAAIGLIVLLRRGHWLTTLLFSSAFLSLAAFQAGTLGLVHADGPASARLWATYLARVSALVSWLWLTLSVVLGRPEPRLQLRNAGAPLVLSLIGCTILSSTANTPFVVREVLGNGPGAVVVFGALGKIYLMYLVVAMVGVLMNIESMQRSAPASGQRRLRALFIAILVSMLGELLVVSAGLLYGGLRVSWLVSTAPLLFIAGSAAAMSLARRRLSDMDVPVARPVIYYSSVSLTLAGAFMLSTLVLSRLIPALSHEWRIGVILGFLVFVGGGGLILMLSPRTSRAIKRFIDRNFYANRYDYRREWERVSHDLTPTARPEELARQVETLVCAIFDAERATIHLRDDKAGVFRRLHGPEGVQVEVPPDDLLVKHLEKTMLPVLLHDLEDDLDLIPLVVESRPTLEATDAAVCAPLAVGDALIGLLWVSRKRNNEDWSLEDLEFLGAMSRQVAAALWFSRQSELATEMRQMESLHRLTTFVLHDIKNQVSGLSLVVENAKRHLGNPDFQRDAMAVVGSTVASLRELMNQVSGIARAPHIEPAPCSVQELVADALLAAGMAQLDASGPLRLDLRVTERGDVVVDRRLLTRVIVNLLTNAREAMPGPGRIELAAEVAEEPRTLVVSVHDDGRGMNEEFLRTRLFRPFATTKPNGLGIGLAQSRSIVEAHGGRIEVRSRPGAGTTFTVHIPADGRAGNLHDRLEVVEGRNP